MTRARCYTLWSLLLCCALVAHTLNAAPMIALTNPISYGRVNHAQLSDLAPAGNKEPYDLLLHQRLDEAVPVLEQEAARHPMSLVAYVGLMQVSPSQWADEISRLKKEVARSDARPADQFKLGTLLLYKWGQQAAPPKDKELLGQAQAFLGRAWQRDHTPIVGLMLGEALEVERASSDPSLKGLSAKAINERLIRELAGPEAYSLYMGANKNGWHSPPPSVALVPVAMRAPLLAVVTSLGSFSHRREGYGKFVNGRLEMVWDPVTSSQVAQQQYMDDWRNALIAATKEA